jgi:hypothetical protein
MISHIVNHFPHLMPACNLSEMFTDPTAEDSAPSIEADSVKAETNALLGVLAKEETTLLSVLSLGSVLSAKSSSLLSEVGSFDSSSMALDFSVLLSGEEPEEKVAIDLDSRSGDEEESELSMRGASEMCPSSMLLGTLHCLELNTSGLELVEVAELNLLTASGLELVEAAEALPLTTSGLELVEVAEPNLLTTLGLELVEAAEASPLLLEGGLVSVTMAKKKPSRRTVLKEHLNAKKAKAKAPVGKIPLTLPLFLHPHTLRHIFEYLMIEITFDRSLLLSLLSPPTCPLQLLSASLPARSERWVHSALRLAIGHACLVTLQPNNTPV